jgi:hypothetical protein
MLRAALAASRIEDAMNERHLRRLLTGMAWSAPLSATLALACGGVTNVDNQPPETQGGSAQGGSSSGSNAGGHVSGGDGNIAGTVSHPGGVGNIAGTGGVGNTGGTGTAGSGGAGGSGTCGHPDTVGCSFATYTVPNTALPLEVCKVICGPSSFSCTVTNATASTVTVSCPPGCAVGRRPAGFCPSLTLESQALGKYFAQLAELEAASVTAFRILRDELRAHGAPRRLVRAASRAARDEIRHARATRALARRSGGAAAPVAPTKPVARSLEAIALENAVEGCVRETFGALLATHQAEHAADPVVRAAMQRISADETRHAALSWQVARWLDTRLSPAARTRVTAARRHAARELVQGAAHEEAPAFATRIGLPDRPRAAALAAALSRALWENPATA